MKFSGNCQIAGKIVVTPRIFRLDIDCPLIARTAQPGQFVQLRIPDCRISIWPRPFSIHGVAGDSIRIYVKIYGRITELLGHLKIGDTLYLAGPLGNGFILPQAKSPLCLVAGGVGLPPLHFLAKTLIARGYPPDLIHLYSGAKTRSDLFADDDLRELGINYTEVTEDGSAGIKGLATDPFRMDIRRSGDSAVFACGPMAMLGEVARISADRPCQLSLEQLMPCGWGVCNGCAVKIKSDGVKTEDERGFRLARVCKEGPVFEAGTVLWE